MMGVSAGHPHKGYLNQWLARGKTVGKASLLSPQASKAKMRDEAFQREKGTRTGPVSERTWCTEGRRNHEE